ncbi:hypothetical protein C8Q76DRAFT_697154 [Earliella scabrosa]|nr:hypothetical protein C8Q76DRAFT_697154 [Earliella scabrosa]
MPNHPPLPPLFPPLVHDICVAIVDLLDADSLVRLRLTFKLADQYVTAVLLRRWRAIFRPAIDSMDAFMQKFHAHRCIVTGLAALNFLYPGHPKAPIVDILVPRGQYTGMRRYLMRTEGFVKLQDPVPAWGSQPSQSASPTPTTGVPTSTDSPPPVALTVNPHTHAGEVPPTQVPIAQPAVTTLPLPDVLNQIHLVKGGVRLNLCECDGDSTLYYVTTAWNSALFNYVSSRSFTIAYPALSSQSRALVNPLHLDVFDYRTPPEWVRAEAGCWHRNHWDVSLDSSAWIPSAPCNGVRSSGCWWAGRRTCPANGCLVERRPDLRPGLSCRSEEAAGWISPVRLVIVGKRMSSTCTISVPASIRMVLVAADAWVFIKARASRMPDYRHEEGFYTRDLDPPEPHFGGIPLVLRLQICAALEFRDLLVFRRCARVTVYAVARLMDIRLGNIVHAFAPFPRALLEHMRDHNVFIGGSAAVLFFLHHLHFRPRSLDLYVSRSQHRRAYQHLHDEQEGIVLRKMDETNTDAAVLEERMLFSVIWFKTRAGVIALHTSASFNSPLGPICRAWCSALVAFIHPDHFGFGYPTLLSLQRALVGKYREDEPELLEKWQARGLDLRLASHLWGDLGHPVCSAAQWSCHAQIRRFDDRGAVNGCFRPHYRSPFYTHDRWRMDIRPCGGSCLNDNPDEAVVMTHWLLVWSP